MPKKHIRNRVGLKRLKNAVKKGPTLDASAAALGLTRNGLSLFLRRALPEWWEGLKKRRRMDTRNRANRRNVHKREARALAEAIAADPAAWETLTPRQQALVRAHQEKNAPGGGTPTP